MISGLNMHCVKTPRMSVVRGPNFTWIELSSGEGDEHNHPSSIAIHPRGVSAEDLQRAVDGFNAGFAKVVAVVEDEPRHLIAAE